MQRYSLTRSGVCDCMYKDNNGPWVKYEDAEQAHREADESAKDAFRRGWEQAKMEAKKIVDQSRLAVSPFHTIRSRISAMEYEEKANE